MAKYHIRVVFSIKLLLKLIWLKVELSIIVMSCMTSASQWKFPATQLALYTHHSGWLELAEAGENRFNRV